MLLREYLLTKALIPNKLFGTPLLGSWECELMVSGEEKRLFSLPLDVLSA